MWFACVDRELAIYKCIYEITGEKGIKMNKCGGDYHEDTPLEGRTICMLFTCLPID